MTDDERDVLVCALKRAHNVAPGSLTMLCETCGAEVIVAPSSLTIIAQGVQLLCMDCALRKMIAMGKKPGVMEPDPETLANLKAMGYTDRDITEMIENVYRLFGPPERNQ